MKNRIIPCLDVDKGRVVKGKKFKDIQDVADPIEQAKKYVSDGADELVFYDITASVENRNLFIETIAKIAEEVEIPFTVGGGIRTLQDIEKLFEVGVDKVSINSAAIKNSAFIKEAAETYGTERIVFAMDVKQIDEGKWNVFSHGGQVDTGIDAIEWAIKGEELGAGEIVVNSIDADGIKNGYSITLTRQIAESVSIPVVASGGAGKMEDFYTALTEGKADAVLAASVFHYGDIHIKELKAYLQSKL